MYRNLFVLAALAVSPALATSITITNSTAIGTEWDVFFNGNASGVNVPGLTSNARFKLTSFGLENGFRAIGLQITINNTSSAPITVSRVSGIGFDTDPSLRGVGKSNAVGDTRVSGLFSNDNSGSFPNNFGDIDVCFNDANSCSGGGGGGVTVAAKSGTMNAVLVFNHVDLPNNTKGPGNSFLLNNFGVRYQSITGGGLNGASGTGKPIEANPVPEPSTWALLGMAATFLGARRFAGR